MLKTKKLHTYEDYASMPEDKRYELIWGEILKVPSPDVPHQALGFSLAQQVSDHVKKTDAGSVYVAPLDVVLDRHSTVQPDIIFVSKARANIVTDKNIQGAPDLVFEIVSSGSADRDKLVKRKLYEEHGVREYWLVDREEKQITVYILKGRAFKVHGVFGEGDTATSLVLPGLRIDVTALFKIRR